MFALIECDILFGSIIPNVTISYTPLNLFQVFFNLRSMFLVISEISGMLRPKCIHMNRTFLLLHGKAKSRMSVNSHDIIQMYLGYNLLLYPNEWKDQ